jgi:hypothetical protein
VVECFVDFRGKIILLTNVLPQTKEVQAFLSRCLSYPIVFRDSEIKSMIVEAASSKEHFESVELARQVAELIANQEGVDFSQVNLRTLRMGYELAKTQPESWKEVLPHLLPRAAGAIRRESYREDDQINPNLPARLQAEEFCKRTGKSRRTFYLYKKKQGLTRPYRTKPSV